MATYSYSGGSNASTFDTYIWRGVLTSTVTAQTATSFDITDTDGSVTEVSGSGFTYDGNGRPNAGTITTVQRVSSSSAPLDALTNITGLTGAAFGTELASSATGAFDLLFAGDDTLTATNTGTAFLMLYDGGAGANTLDLTSDLTGDSVVFHFVSGEEGVVNSNVHFDNIKIFEGDTDGSTLFTFEPNLPGATILQGLTLYGKQGAAISLQIDNTANSSADLNLLSDTLQHVTNLYFNDTGVTAGTLSTVEFDAIQFGGGGVSNALAVHGDPNTTNLVKVHMLVGGSSFNASGFTFTSKPQDMLSVDGSAASSNITIVGANVGGSLYGGAGNDALTVFAPETVNGGAGFNTVIEGSASVTVQLGSASMTNVQEFVANSGTNTISVNAADADFVYLYGGTGNDTMSTGSGGGYMFDNNGGTNTLTGGTGPAVFVGGGTSHNTMNGGSGNNTYYTTANDTIHGAGTFNTDVLLTGNVTLAMGSSGVQEVVLNSGTNSLSMTGSSQFVYLYGGAGNDTLTTGSGGGYMFGEGGTNVLNGGGGTNIFIGGGGGSNTMNGGSGVNYYYSTGADTIHGAGTFNAIVELNAGVTETLGTGSRQNIQEVIANSGTNVIDAENVSTQVYLYGGSDADLLFGGTGNDYLYGGTGSNEFGFNPGWGHDTIMDWNAGTNNELELSLLAPLGVHAVTDLTQTISGGNDVITSSHTGTNSITLMGVGSALTASSFHFQ